MNSIVINNIRLPVSADDGDIIDAAAARLSRLNVSFDKKSLHIHKRSVDARHKDDIAFVASVCGEISDFPEMLPDDVRLIEHGNSPESICPGTEKMCARPVIVGFGPAGMFAAMLLAAKGYRPLVLERGGSVRERVEKSERFFRDGVLDTNTNVQFGAGGAGTFSDGKLTTRIGDSRCRYVLERFVELGAPKDILWKAKPHVGTDVLRSVVEAAEKKIVSLGGQVRYNARVTDIGSGWVSADNEKIPAGAVILAVGHSARDIYGVLMDKNYFIEAKPFSIGLRAEHLQSRLDAAMYGNPELSEKLGHAEYQLSYRKGARGAYSFCMCPGGSVMAASSEEGGVVTNGMSTHARDGINANAALCVSVLPTDFGGDPNGAMEFQRSLERAAFVAGGGDYSAPCQSYKGFTDGVASLPRGDVSPTYRNGCVRAADFNSLLPPFAVSMLKEGMANFGRKIRGFDYGETPLTGIETRTSAPLRILRDDNFLAIGKKSVYPCGEGAGYAGGIMSAAVDGIRTASAVISRYLPLD